MRRANRLVLTLTRPTLTRGNIADRKAVAAVDIGQPDAAANDAWERCYVRDLFYGRHEAPDASRIAVLVQLLNDEIIEAVVEVKRPGHCHAGNKAHPRHRKGGRM